MSSSSGPENTWLALIDPFRRRLNSYNQTAISSEDEFRTALIGLCEQHREWQAQRLITRIRKQHSSIIDLARGIDTALHLAAAAAGFAALIWRTAYTAARVSTVHTMELNILEILLTACRRLWNPTKTLLDS
jgi:malate/lactate dehydrogenase